MPPIPPLSMMGMNPRLKKETEVTKDKVLPSTKDIQPPVIQKSQDPVKPVSSPISPEPSSAQVDNSPPSNEPSNNENPPGPFLRTARVLIDVHGEELVIRDGEEIALHRMVYLKLEVLEMNDKKVEFLEKKAKEDFETKGYVFYVDFNLVDVIFPMTNIQGNEFVPGIYVSCEIFLKQDAFEDRVQKS
ncbi:hypothetical protein Tco_1203881 [Tanacetum coccineum]